MATSNNTSNTRGGSKPSGRSKKNTLKSKVLPFMALAVKKMKRIFIRNYASAKRNISPITRPSYTHYEKSKKKKWFFPILRSSSVRK